MYVHQYDEYRHEKKSITEYCNENGRTVAGKQNVKKK